MRRLPVFVVLLAMLLLAAPATALAEDAADEDVVVLAAEAGDPVGPVPAERTADDNAARELAGAAAGVPREAVDATSSDQPK